MQIINCISDFAQTSTIHFQTNSGTRQNSLVNNLLIQDCFLSDSPYGIYVYQPPLNTFPLRPNDFRNITIRNTRFERITYKGVYVERLQDALFDGITMIDCGNDPVYANPNGINLNLKYADFSNITIQNSTFTRCGLTEKQNAACLYIEGRADNAYATNPATLTNVNIVNCLIDESTRGLVEGKSTDVNVIQTQIYNCTKGVTTMGVTNFLMERCVIMNNNRELLPFFTTADTYGVAIAGRLYPNTTFGPFFGATNATIRYCVFCGHQNAGLANADEVLNVRQFGFIPSSIDARYNWWGANDGPSSMAPGHGDPIGPATITYNPWLTMRITASNSQIILGGQTSIITVYLDRLSDGTVPSSTIMDGVLGVTFTTTLGLFENGLASITKTITGGEAQATLHSTSYVGDATIQAYTGCSSTYSVCQTTVKIIGNVVFEIRKSARKSALTKGENASFVISVTNKGNVPALNVVLTDAYPKELAYISSMPSGSQGLDKVTFNVGTLLPGRTESFEITFKLDDKIDIPEGKLMVTNEAIVTGNNYYTGVKSTNKDSSIVSYTQHSPALDMQVNIKWNGLDTRNNTISSKSKLYLQISVDGGKNPCQITVDWGDGQNNKKTLDATSPVELSHSWSNGQYTVTIKVVDAYGKTKIIKRKINVV